MIQTLEIEGKRYVLLKETEYRRLAASHAGRALDADLPPLPEPDERGHVPAIEYTRASIARQIIRERIAAGLSQQRLAKLAGVRQETLSRIESGKHTPTLRTIKKIDRVLAARRKRK